MRKKLIFVLTMMLIITVSCTKKNPIEDRPAIDNQQTRHTEALTGKIFPHTSSFSFYHGKYYKKDKESCKKCHGPDHKGGDSKISCFKCHEHFHPGRKRPKKHGSLFVSNPANCTKCHKLQENGDHQNARCRRCHNFPHPKGWSKSKKHGKEFLEDSKKLSCKRCHKNNSRLMRKFPDKVSACDHCHIQMPHSDDFKEGDHSEMALKYEGACTRCHKGYEANLPDTESCTNCHDGASHIEANWIFEAEVSKYQHKKRLYKRTALINKKIHAKKKRVISSEKPTKK